MEISLHSILSHESFDWTSRRSQVSLLQNMLVVVREMALVDQVACDKSSALFKSMVKVYNLSKKPKNTRQGLQSFLKQEDEELRSFKLKIERDAQEDDVEMKDCESDEEDDEEESEEEEDYEGEEEEDDEEGEDDEGEEEDDEGEEEDDDEEEEEEKKKRK